MGILDALRGLFGGRGKAGLAAAGEAVEYRGYRITPAPERQASGWNTAGVIAKSFEDGVKERRSSGSTPIRAGRCDRLLDHQGAADRR